MMLKHRKLQKVRFGGNEIESVVIKSNVNPKTVTTRAWWQTFTTRYYRYMKRGHNYHAHDETEFARTGDLVVIKHCQKMSEIKPYFVRNVLRETGRIADWNKLSPDQQDLSKQKQYGVYTKQKIDFAKLKSDDDMQQLLLYSGHEKDIFKVRAMTDAVRRIRATEVKDNKDRSK